MNIIAGPCSWESEKQAKETIDFLCGECGVKYIRGGFKKYRSDPKMFQGVGILDGMDMLEDLKKKYGFKLVVEVFCERDLKDLENFADIWQIGSRNAYNTELLRETNMYDKPVLYKRHYSMGLAEMVRHSNYMTNQVIMCLRGIQSLHETEQRFYPDFTDIPRLRELTKNQICYDVSHSSCHSKYVLHNIIAAKVYAPEWMMIEVHPDPAKALSDPDQQLNFKEFKLAKELLK